MQSRSLRTHAGRAQKGGELVGSACQSIRNENGSNASVVDPVLFSDGGVSHPSDTPTAAPQQKSRTVFMNS